MLGAALTFASHQARALGDDELNRRLQDIIMGLAALAAAQAVRGHLKTSQLGSPQNQPPWARREGHRILGAVGKGKDEKGRDGG